MSRPSGEAEAPKTFTVSEAEALLPTIGPIIEQLQGLFTALDQNSGQLDSVSGEMNDPVSGSHEAASDRLRVLTAQQLELAETFEASLAQLEGYGCILKDLRMGLVDFYAVRDGKLIFLCWKLDEPSIRHWHSLDGGFSARQPLDNVF